MFNIGKKKNYIKFEDSTEDNSSVEQCSGFQSVNLGDTFKSRVGDIDDMNSSKDEKSKHNKSSQNSWNDGL